MFWVRFRLRPCGLVATCTNIFPPVCASVLCRAGWNGRKARKLEHGARRTLRATPDGPRSFLCRAWKRSLGWRAPHRCNCRFGHPLCRKQKSMESTATPTTATASTIRRWPSWWQTRRRTLRLVPTAAGSVLIWVVSALVRSSSMCRPRRPEKSPLRMRRGWGLMDDRCQSLRGRPAPRGFCKNLPLVPDARRFGHCKHSVADIWRCGWPVARMRSSKMFASASGISSANRKGR